MSSSFSQLKKTSNSSLESLTKELSKLDDKKSSAFVEDERYWKLTVDKAKNGHAILRFLPSPKGESLPWVRLFTHGFRGETGQWYIENSLTTLGKKDPVSEYPKKKWQSSSARPSGQSRGSSPS